jgi:hypothetical protein
VVGVRGVGESLEKSVSVPFPHTHFPFIDQLKGRQHDGSFINNRLA